MNIAHRQRKARDRGGEDEQRRDVLEEDCVASSPASVTRHRGTNEHVTAESSAGSYDERPRWT